MIRNFQVVAEIDGRKFDVVGGPRAKDGGMVVNVFVRQDGEAEKAVRILCRAHEDGRLTARVLAGPNVRVDHLGTQPGFVVESSG